jgi:hypothetical protein
MFNVSSYKDRLEMTEDLGYGGDLHPILASYANQNIPKQEVVIKKDKKTPVRITLPFVPDISKKEVSDEMINDYLKQVLSQEFYKTKEEIYNQINARSISQNITSPQSRKVDDRKTANTPTVPTGILAREQQQSVSKGDEKPKDPPKKRTIKI